MELIEAMRGARELFATRAEGAWELYRDGMMIGRVSRPAPVPLAQVLSPRATLFDPTRRL